MRPAIDACGIPKEYFHHNKVFKRGAKDNPEVFLEYCNEVFQKGRTDNGVFGIKMHWWQMHDFLRQARKFPVISSKSDLEILNLFFCNPKFIYIWRQDTTAQAISNIIATNTGVWVAPKSNNLDPSLNSNTQKIQKEIPFKPLEIYGWEEDFKYQNKRWRQFLEENRIYFYEVVTEKMVSEFQATMRELVSFLELEIDSSEFNMPTQKQANKVNEDFIRRYRRYPRPLLRLVNKLRRILLSFGRK